MSQARLMVGKDSNLNHERSQRVWEQVRPNTAAPRLRSLSLVKSQPSSFSDGAKSLRLKGT
eukprot:749325-Hanusia_phi.AAC.4